jgi:hypothetical protein
MQDTIKNFKSKFFLKYFSHFNEFKANFYCLVINKCC